MDINLSTGDVAVSHTTSPYVSVYAWSAGFGTKYANPATAVADNGRGIRFKRDGSAIVIGSNLTPFIQAYPWSASGFGTKYANPATLPGNDADGVDFF